MEISREQLDRAAVNACLEVDEGAVIHTDYSGRGMYGATCPALYATSQADVYAFMAALAGVIAEDGGDADDAVALARLTRTDQMGMGIVAYWPTVEVTEPDYEGPAYDPELRGPAN
jgi:hypothetical protein